jgi:hypothetical protein
MEERSDEWHVAEWHVSEEHMIKKNNILHNYIFKIKTITNDAN